MTKLDRADVPFAPVQTVPEVLDDPQIKHLGTFYQQAHPTEGLLTLIRRPISIDGNRDTQSRPPPTLGEHTDEILQELSAAKQNPAPQKS
jgi:crotonobetainyl-CoA:carnitine CoA-transferase CaiB-like acyl-CoA transferase